MCGIAGYYRFSNKTIHGLDAVMDSQLLRGPDAGGEYYSSHLGFGHRRLKIFDLSENGAQPMLDEDLGLALVFNGAIYNFPQLKKELIGLGYHFRSTSDTEVILKAYHAWGINAVERLEGMFAFAIYDKKNEKLILARDRMGIKPLYYSHTSSGFKFASTLPALSKFSDVDTKIDCEALQYYFIFHMVPEPHTLFQGIKKLLPGTIAIIDNKGTIKHHTYWQFQFQENLLNEKSEEEWIYFTRHQLAKASQRQLMADVPAGILLSGGLDSSLLVALASQEYGENLKTFSIGFESVDGIAGDEFYYSDKVAKYFKTDHHKLFISNQQLTHALENCVAAMSEPMVSHDNIGFFLISQEVAKQVKVVLSGQGADELFGGYHWFQGFSADPATPLDSAQLIFEKIADRGFAEYQDLIAPDYQTHDLGINFLEHIFKKNLKQSPLENLMLYESTVALSNGPLARVDNMTMSASIEARVPFLDEMMVDLSSKLPLKYKMQENGKYILKKVAEALLPHEVVHREKGYFPVPALKYIKGQTLTLLQDTLSSQKAQQRGIYNAKHLQRLLEAPHEHLTPTGASKLWQVGLFEYWLQQLNI